MPIATMLREGVAAEARPDDLLPAPAACRPRRRPHICFVAPHAWPVFSRDPRIQVVGGAEVQQSILARLLAANGYRVSMICLDYGQPQGVQLDGVTVHKAFRPTAGLPVLRFVHPRLTSMWRALGAVGADIYCYRSASMWVGVLARFCRRHGRRAIYAGASDKDFVPGAGGQIRYARDRWLYRRGIAAVDRIVVQNALQQRTCRATFKRDSTLIPSCYQLPAESPLRGAGRAGRPEPLVLWVGTLHPNKHPERLLELAERLPHRRFAMIGGPGAGASALFERIRRRAAELPNVQFTGFLPLAETEKWFDRARVLVNTSLYEGMPNVFLQAWARGVPTVSTVDVGAPANALARGVDGLAREVESLLAREDLWASASARCRRHFERAHSSAEVLGRYARLFDELAA